MISVVRFVLAVAAVTVYVVLVWSLNLPEDIWAMLTMGVLVGLATGTWWAPVIALVVVVPVVTDGINDPELSDSTLIVVYGSAGALSIGLGVLVSKLLSRLRGASRPSEGA